MLPLLLTALLHADGGAAVAPAAKTAAPPPAPVAAAQAPAEFIDDVRPLFQVINCLPGALPENLDAKTIEGYCASMKPKYERFIEHWGVTAKKFLTGLRPASVPAELVYPFGGGDLMMALVTFPDAQLVTTMSLELAGDPRRLKTLTDKAKLKQSLWGIAEAATTTLVSNDSKSVNLSKIQRGELPGQLSMHLMGLALNGFVPVSVRYFSIGDDGSLHYYSQAEIDALEGKLAEKLKDEWKPPDFSPAFANVEVQFVPKDQPDATRRVFRHIGADLSDSGLAKNGGLLKHLEAKGQVSVMTKAASYLLWNKEFGTIRDYLVAHADFMISDSTGVLPKYWKKAGCCSIQTYGSFQKSFLGTAESSQEDLRKEFATAKKLPMRFGYPDGSPEKRSHLVVVRRVGGDAGVK